MVNLSIIFTLALTASPAELPVETWPAVVSLRKLESAVVSSNGDDSFKILMQGLPTVPQNSMVLIPFLKRLLQHSSPKIRGEAIFLLQDHHVFLKQSELPKSYIMGPTPEFFPSSEKNVEEFVLQATKWAAGGWQLSCLSAAKAESGLAIARALVNSPNVFSRYRAALALFEYGEIEEGGRALREIADAKEEPQADYYQFAAVRSLVLDGDKSRIPDLFKLALRLNWNDTMPLDVVADLTSLGYITNKDWVEAWNNSQSRKVIEDEERKIEGLSLEVLQKSSPEYAETDEYAHSFVNAIVLKDGRMLALLSQPDNKLEAINNYSRQITDSRRELAAYFFGPKKSLRHFFTTTKHLAYAYFEHKKSVYEHAHIVCMFDSSNNPSMPTPTDFFANTSEYQITLNGQFCIYASKWNNWKIRAEYSFPLRNEE